MKLIWKILLTVVVLGLIAAGYGYYQFSRPNKDLLGAKPDITIDATELLGAFSDNEQTANAKYLNKVINVRGQLKAIERDSSGGISLSLDCANPIAGVACQLDKSHLADAEWVHAGDSVSVVGVCTGYLTDVVLVRCAIDVKKK